jgi:serine/threonine protein kinase
MNLKSNFSASIPTRLKEVLYSEDKLYLIFEYCDYDLKKYMRQVGGALPAHEVKSFTYQIL